MIVRSEPDLLSRCLESVAGICDQIVTVVDDDPDHGVVETCTRFGAVVVHRSMDGHFGDQRNESFRHATGDWILWLDSDDRVDEESALAIRSYVEAVDDGVEAIMMRYDFAHGAADNTTVSLLRERLLRASVGWTWRYPVHEICVPIDGRVARSMIAREGRITHMRTHPATGRNVAIVDRHIDDHWDDPRFTFYSGNEYVASDRLDDAERCYRRSIELDGWHEQRAISEFRLSAILVRNGELDEASEMAMRSMLDCPQRIEPMILLGDISILRGRPEVALHWYGIATSSGTPTTLTLPVDSSLESVARRKFAILANRMRSRPVPKGEIRQTDPLSIALYESTIGRDAENYASRSNVSFE